MNSEPNFKRFETNTLKYTQNILHTPKYPIPKKLIRNRTNHQWKISILDMYIDIDVYHSIIPITEVFI